NRCRDRRGPARPPGPTGSSRPRRASQLRPRRAPAHASRSASAPPRQVRRPPRSPPRPPVSRGRRAPRERWRRPCPAPEASKLPRMRAIAATFDRFFSERGTHLAAMVAYFALASFVPLIFLALSVLGFLDQADPCGRLVSA